MKKLPNTKRNNLNKIFTLLFCLGLLSGIQSFATTYYSVHSGNWASTSTPFTWATSSGGTGISATPGAGDNVVIESSFTVTAAASASITNITVGTANGPGTLSISSTFSVTASGSLSFSSASTNGGTISGAGTLTLSSTGGIAVSTASTFTSTISTKLSLGAVVPMNITTGEVLVVSGVVSGAGGISINPTTTNTGKLQLGGTAANTYSGGTNLYAGELDFMSTGDANLGAAGSLFNIYGGIIDNPSGSAITLSSTSYPIFMYGNFTWIGGNALTFTNNVTLEADITIAMGTPTTAEKSFYMCDAAGTSIQGPTGNLNGFSLTINENSATQSTTGFVCGKSGTKAPSVVNLKNLTIGTNASFIPSELTAGAPLNLTGNFTNNGSFSPTSVSIVEMIGTTPQTIGGSTNTSFNTLTINNTSSPATGAVSLTGNISIANTYTLTLQSGDLSLGNYNLTMTPNTFITNSTSSPFTYIITNGTGALIETPQSSPTTYLYPVGDNANPADYTPMTLAFSASPTTGTIGVIAGNTEYTNNKSNVNFLDRYWTISQSGLSSYTCTSLTGTYLSGTPADINGNVANIDNAIWTGTSWTTYGAVTTSPYNVVVSGTSINPFGTVSGIDNSLPTLTSFSQGCTSLTANVSGGETPYTYLWSPGGATTSSISPSVSSYTCYVTDANEFTTSLSVNYTALAPNPTFTNVTCATPVASAQVAPSGGVTPYTYSWNTGATTSSISPLSPGVYTYSVTDFGGCQKTGTITISNTPLGLSISGVTSQVDCTPGGATATASGGVSPYTYSWSGGLTGVSTGGLAFSLSGGTYTVTAQDNNGCSNTASVTINSSQMRDSIQTGVSQIIHYWDFNNTQPTGGGGGTALGTMANPLPAQYTLIPGGNPTIVYSAAAGDGILDNGSGGSAHVNNLNSEPLINAVIGDDSNHSTSGNLYVRSRNPSVNSFMYLYLPTTGYSNIVLNYAISASGSNAANYNILRYSVDNGTTWKKLTTSMDTFNIHGVHRPDTLQVLNPTTTASGWLLRTINFTSDPSVNNNAGFIVRWEFEGPNASLSSSNDRYDNISLTGTLLNVDACNGANAYVSTKYGVTPYTYSWSNGTTTVSTSNPAGPVLTTGTYTVTVTDANNCSSTATTTIGSTPSAVSASISSSTEATCNVPGNATASVSGGITPYAYIWSNGTDTVSVTNPSGNVLIAGNYTLTVFDANGCTATTSVSITQPPVVTVSILSTQNIECNAHGSASISASGGTSPFTYTWSNGETTTNVTDFSSGTYTITVTDINGCTGTNSVTISTVSLIRDSIMGANTVIHYWDFNQTPPSGGGGGDSLGNSTNPLNAPYSLLSGLNPRIVYSHPTADGILDNGSGGAVGGENFEYKNLLGNDTNHLTADNLYVRARNRSDSASMYLYLPTTGYSNIVLNYAMEESTTSGADYNNLSYSIDGGSTWKNLTQQMDTFTVHSNPTPDTLTVYGITSWTPVSINFSSDLTVNNNPNFVVRWTFLGPNSNNPTGNDRYDNISISGNLEETCNGGTNATLVAGVKYGVSPFTYVWSPNVSTTGTASNLSAGSYSVTVSDAYGCSASASYTISEPPALAATASVTANIFPCNGGNNGSGSVTASGGSLPYSYTWSSGETTSSISGKTAGTYTVSVMDNCSKSATASLTITQPDALTASGLTSTNLSCNGNSNGSGNVTTGGGTTPYTYTWSNGATTSSISGLTASTYTVNITDANNCSATAAITITQPDVLNGHLTITSDVLCTGYSDGSATSATTGGTSPYTYLWSNGATTSSVSGLAAGLITLKVTDINNCVYYYYETVSQPSQLRDSMRSTTTYNISCNGGSNGGAKVGVSGGKAPYTYSWAPVSCTNANISGLSAGTYSVFVTDKNGCSGTTASVSITLTQPGMIRDSLISHTNPICIGSNTGAATIGVKGGTSPYTFIWTPRVSTLATATGLSAGNYTVEIEDQNRCISNFNFTLTQSSTLRDSIAVGSLVGVLCNGTSSGSAMMGVKNGATPYTYNWLPSGGTNATASNLSAGTYTVHLTDANGCTGSASTTITQPGILRDSMISADITEIECNGSSTGSATVGVKGGTSPYTYVWSPLSGNKSKLTGMSAGTYTVNITDKNGCTTSSVITITQPAAISENVVSLTAPTCNGGDNGTATIGVNGGTTPYTYIWNPSISTTASATNLKAQSYTLKVKDKNGCSGSIVITITQPLAIRDSIVAATKVNVLCEGNNTGSATVGAKLGVSPYTYLWSPGGGTNQTESTLSAGTYTVTVSDRNGCTSTTSTTITQPAMLRDSVVTQSCNGDKGSATMGVKGGKTPYTYSWSPGGGTKANMTGLSNGSYTITITDKNGCSQTDGVSFLCALAPPNGDGPVMPDTCCTGGQSSQNINLYPNPNTGEFRIEGVQPGQIVQMYDYTGRLVKTETAGNSTIILNISNEANGVYMVRVLSKTGALVAQKKVVKTQ